VVLGKRFRRKTLQHRKPDVDMTQGNILRHILTFAFPLLIGNLFQQLYNTVDTWVVGNYVSNTAFSAVGTVAPIINMLIGFFMGLSSGAGVVISQYYGAKQVDKVQQTVHTAIMLTLIMAAICTVAGIAVIPLMLKLIKMPADALPEATAYLTVYFSGLIGLMLYNMGAGILRAVGDSKRPFYFLVICALLNTVLDLLFVLVFDMGVEGVALATALSQAISAMLVLILLMRSNSCVNVRLTKLRLHTDVLKKIFKVGVPAGLQLSITAFSNIFVQSYINYFGTDCMSGYTAYTKVDQLLILPMQSIGLALTTFVGQNLGCNQLARTKKGVRYSMITALSSTAVLLVPIIWFAPQIVAFLNAKAEVIEYGSTFLRYMSPAYLLCVFNVIYSGALRGSGDTRTSTLITLMSYVVFRQIYLFIVSQVCNEILLIALSYPAGWLVCSIAHAIYYHSVDLSKKKLV